MRYSKSLSRINLTGTGTLVILLIGLIIFPAEAQEAGGRVFGNGSASLLPRSQNIEIDSGKLLLKARVLMKVEPQSYKVVFALKAEAETVEKCTDAMDDRIADFKRALSRLNIPEEDIFRDFVLINRVYKVKNNTETEGFTAAEKLQGFEISENLIIRFREHKLLGRMIRRAAEIGIHDLVKIDYEISNPEQIRALLFEEAKKVIEDKVRRYSEVCDHNFKNADRSISGEGFSQIQPGDFYGVYEAKSSNYESSYSYSSRDHRVLKARPFKTYYLRSPDPADFDKILNRDTLRPSLMCVYVLEVLYRLD